MITLEDLFLFGSESDTATLLPAVNPFQDVDALLESQVLDIRYDGIRSTMGIIFELRMSYYLHNASTGLLIASNITEFSWDQVDRHNDRTAWTVYDCKAHRTPSGLSLELTSTPTAKFLLNAERASFYQLRIPHLENTAPPDYGDPDFSEIIESIATWNSRAEIMAAAHFRPSEVE